MTTIVWIYFRNIACQSRKLHAVDTLHESRIFLNWVFIWENSQIDENCTRTFTADLTSHSPRSLRQRHWSTATHSDLEFKTCTLEQNPLYVGHLECLFLIWRFFFELLLHALLRFNVGLVRPDIWISVTQAFALGEFLLHCHEEIGKGSQTLALWGPFELSAICFPGETEDEWT